LKERRLLKFQFQINARKKPDAKFVRLFLFAVLLSGGRVEDGQRRILR
jgi:hypothetical protein